jgi:hypothetical protein
MKKCAYRIHLVEYKFSWSQPEEYDFHYDTAIEAVTAWDKFKDSNGANRRVLTFMGAAGDFATKQFSILGS